MTASDETDRPAPSKSAKKRESAALQKLGEELTRLTPEARAEMNLSPELLEALAEYDKTRDREAIRRQKQYIGKLMRGEDIQSISAALGAARALKNKDIKLFRRAEQWRDAILTAGEEDLDDLANRLAAETSLDGKVARSLMEKAREASGDAARTASSRTLFRELTKIFKAGEEER